MRADYSHNYAPLGGYVPKGKKLSPAEKKERASVHYNVTVWDNHWEIMSGKKGMKRPPLGCNSAYGRQKDQFVIFDAHQILPEAIIEYKTSKRKVHS